MLYNSITNNVTGKPQMSKFTTTQLQAALIALRNRTDAEGTTAYQMTFDEVAARMGNDAFDAWCDTWY